jgi:hypothetical protein
VHLTWKGELFGMPVEGFVQAGACHGSFEVCSAVEALVTSGVRVGLGPRSGPARLDDPFFARATIDAVLDAGTAVFEGEPVPAQAAVPEGAEA